MYQSTPTPIVKNPADSETGHCAYYALIQRALAAGLSNQQIINALMETTGATKKTILKELDSLNRG